MYHGTYALPPYYRVPIVNHHHVHACRPSYARSEFLTCRRPPLEGSEARARARAHALALRSERIQEFFDDDANFSSLAPTPAKRGRGTKGSWTELIGTVSTSRARQHQTAAGALGRALARLGRRRCAHSDGCCLVQTRSLVRTSLVCDHLCKLLTLSTRHIPREASACGCNWLALQRDAIQIARVRQRRASFGYRNQFNGEMNGARWWY